jgi:hypothetical protein
MEARLKSPIESGIAMWKSAVDDRSRANCEGAVTKLCNSLQIRGLF